MSALTDPVRRSAAAVLVCLSLAGCGGATEGPGPGGPPGGGMPADGRRGRDAGRKAGGRGHRVHRHGEVAPVDDDPAAGRRLPDPHRRPLGRSGARGRGADGDRRRPPGGGGGEPRGAARRPRVGSRLLEAADPNGCETLLEAGAVSQQEYDQAAATLRSGEAQLAAIDQQIREQRVELGYHRVVAPTAGVVGDIPVRVGDRVTQSTVLTTVDDNQGLEVYLQVPVQQAPSLVEGCRCASSTIAARRS